MIMNSTKNVSDVVTSTIAPGHSLPVTPVVVLLLFGSSGNIVAMIVLVHSSKKHKWKTFYRLVAALAVSDLIGICGPLSLSIAAYANNKRWIGGQAACDFVSFCLIFTGLASAYIACAMSLDRYIAVGMPHFYSKHVTNSRVNGTLVILWVTSLFIACLPLIGINKNTKQFPGTWCFINCIAKDAEDKFFSFFYASLGTLAIILMVFLNTFVMILLCKRRMKTKIEGNRTGQRTRQNLNDIYNMIFLVVLMAVFVVCWVPLMVRIFINQINMVQRNPAVDLLVMRLVLANQLMDPWIYILLRKDFLESFFKFVKKHVTSKCPRISPWEDYQLNPSENVRQMEISRISNSRNQGPHVSFKTI